MELGGSMSTVMREWTWKLWKVSLLMGTDLIESYMARSDDKILVRNYRVQCSLMK